MEAIATIQPETEQADPDTQEREPAETRIRQQRKGQELEKFKRRMIRAVARRLRENKPEDEVWTEMKKEIGSNCKTLWERMRMLTLKKLKRLMEADDRVCNIGPVARMTLTDWLLFDLVIVHDKIDVIDREKLTGNYNSKVLRNLFSLVQRFEIEGRVGENLAEAWTAATVYYNSKGHQCSPMMLQRRWYQIKELTRHKFYKFWFSYRGNVKQLEQAKQNSPDDLQKAIALKYPHVVTQPFPSWEERIQNRLVILPEELGVKMRQTKLMKPSDVNAPDVVLIEPQIEVIDLGADSDPENETAETIATQTNFQIKSEPVDVDDHFEIEEAVYMPQEKGSEFEAEIERLQMVEEKMSDVDELQDPAEIEDNDESTIYPDPDQQENNEEPIPISDTNVDNTNAFIVTVNEEALETVDDCGEAIASITTLEENPIVNSEKTIDEDVIVIQNEDNELQSTSYNNIDKEDKMTSNQVDTVGGIAEVLAESKSVNTDTCEQIVEVKKEICTEAIVENDNSPQIQTDIIIDQAQSITEEEHLPVISTVVSAEVKIESISSDYDNVDTDVLMADKTSTVDHSLDQTQIEEPGILPVISTVSSAGVKVEVETTSVEFELDLQNADELTADTKQEPVADNVIAIEDDIIKLELPDNDDGSEVISETVNHLTEFPNIHKNLNFADDGIEFADDGIEYVEDEDDIITVTEPPATVVKTEIEEQAEDEIMDEEDEDEGNKTNPVVPESQKFDLKLLMYPVVYTTKLEAMSIFDDDSMYQQVYQKESIDKILTLSKPVSKQAVNNTEQLELEQNKCDRKSTEDNVQEDNEDLENEGDDDLFQNESDSDTEIIDDSKRVKMSSYMLQKPKNRSYNPILLCKNPDFNTRLKRLTVGFFMSARNRMLLQSCKPMTIDMSKAFESKLINGTMYIKPTPADAVINIADTDIEVTSADLIKPTCVQQSLMNIDDTLENELKKRIAERNRAINLPDISEVRRLNQHLKTAEVTPLRSYVTRLPDENIRSSLTTEKPTYPTNYIENIKKDIDNMLSQRKTEIIIDSIPNIIQAKPQQVKPVTPSLPSPQIPQVIEIDTNNVTQIVARKDVLVNNNTQEIVNNTIPKNKPVEPMTAANKDKPEKARKIHKKTYYPTLSWNKPIGNVAAVRDDSLLTIDTLYKMLSALDPCAKMGLVNPVKTKKKTKTNISHTDNSKKKEDDHKIVPKDSNDKSNETSTVNDISSTVNDISSTVNDISSTVIDITDDNVSKPVQNKERKSKTLVRKKIVQDPCCWCRYIIDFLYGRVMIRRRHKCPAFECKCCCKNLFMQDIQCKNSNMTAVRNLRAQLKFLVTEYIEKEACENADKTDDAVAHPVDHDYTIPFETNPQTDIPMPSIKINFETSNNNSGFTPTKSRRKLYTRIKSKGLDTFDHSGTSEPKQSSTVGDIQTVTSVHNCSCGPSISQVSRGKIEINGSCSCKQKKTLVKESKIYLRKKHISAEYQPFFVGKGKILLTNMKMPRNNSLLKPTLPDSESPSTCQESVTSEGDAPLNFNTQNVGILPANFSLPDGVQIVMLPDQTLSYYLQPDTNLTPDECAGLTNLLQTIQQQVNAAGIIAPVDQPVANTSEVIDLESDESPQVNNPLCISSSEENVKTNKSSTEAFATKSSNDSCQIDNIDDSQRGTADNTPKSDPLIRNMDTREINEMQCIDSTISKDCVPNDEPITGSKDSLPEKDKLGVSEHTKSSEDNTILNAGRETTQEFKDESGNAERSSSNKKNLLSDLMEMSGIFEEDIAPLTQNILPEEPMATSSAVDSLMADMTPQTLPSLSQPTILKRQLNDYELCAVTSFAELKYACDNNGIFFKLDLETGEMKTINVCIQKYSSGKIKSNVDSDKSVIDLTDDPDIRITGSTEEGASDSPKKLPNQFDILAIKRRVMERLSNNLKPINIAQSKKHMPRILKKSLSLIRDPSFSFYSKRKRDKIEAQIDLVDSEDDEVDVKNCDISDSDDEPLIKKAKRKREAEAVASITLPEDKRDDMPITTLNESVEQQDQEMTEQESNDKNIENDSDQDDIMGEEEYLEDMDDLIPSDDNSESMPVPTNLVLSGNALSKHNIPLDSTVSGDGEDDSSQDCILGV